MRIRVVNEKNLDLDTKNFKIEMSRAESAFVVDLLQKYKPRKILEVGVASGGTSALILKTITGEQRLHSVDLCRKYYRDKNYETGYITKEICSKDEISRQNLYLGEDIVSVIHDIGEDIDFCILDTSHALPGELLHFIAIYPFLAKNACVVLHDLTLNKKFDADNIGYRSEAFCTKLLFSTVVSDTKILLAEPLSNIGAFFIDNTTKENIENIFLALSISWHSYPHEDIVAYAKLIQKYYSPFCLAYFKESAYFQAKLVTFKHRLVK